MDVVEHETLLGWLTRLQLTAIRDQLDSLLDEAAEKELTLREALAFLVEREVSRKDERRIEMAFKIAQYDQWRVMTSDRQRDGGGRGPGRRLLVIIRGLPGKPAARSRP